MTDSALDNAFEEAVRAIELAVKKMRKAWDDIVDNVNFALRILPGYLEERLRRSMERATTEYRNADVWIWDMLLERGSAGAVRQAASDWNAKVGEVASNHSKLLAFGQIPSNGLWSGPAQLAYRSVVDLQTQTLVELKGMTDKVQSTLNDIADAIKSFWVKMAVTVLALEGAMVGIAVMTATGVLAPAAIVALIVAIVGFWTAVFEFTNDFHNKLDSKKAELEAQTAQNGSEGQWPPVNADLSDATVRDDPVPDPSDWTPNL
jgi:hypothetical protein